MRGGDWPAARYAVPIAFLAGVACVLTSRFNSVGVGGAIWLAGAFVSFVIRTPHYRRSQGLASEVDLRDAPEKTLLMSMFAAMLVMPMIYLVTGFPSSLDYTLPSFTLWLGCLLQLGHIYLFWRSHAYLGLNWSPSLEIRERHTLVVKGIYRHIRHPMYAAIWLGALAQPLLIQNWFGGFAVLPVFALMYFTRVPKEERMMQERFGKQYDDYCLRSGRLFPPVGLRKEVS